MCRTPEAGQSTSISTFSVSRTYRGWPSATWPPSATNHWTMVPSVMATPAWGILIQVRLSLIASRQCPDRVGDADPLGIVEGLEFGGIGDRRVGRAPALGRRGQLPEELVGHDRCDLCSRAGEPGGGVHHHDPLGLRRTGEHRL